MGTVNALRYFNGVRDSLEDNLAHIDEIGQGHLNNNYPLGWAMAGNTPLKRYKQNTHGGGIRDPLVVSWPARIAGENGIRTQFHHVSDVTPTVFDLLGLVPPAEIGGVQQQPLEGTSFAYTFASPDAPTAKDTQYFEMLGHRGIWRQGWKAVTFHRAGTPFDEDQWELYHVDNDFNEFSDLSGEQPEKLREMIDCWWAEAGRNKVLPLLGLQNRFAVQNPNGLSKRQRQVLLPGEGRIPPAAAPDLRNRSYTITAEVDIPSSGAEGILVAQGDSCGGYALMIQDGYLVHDYNFVGYHSIVTSARPVPAGKSALRYEMRKTGPFSGEGTLFINGESVGTVAVPQTTRGQLSFTGLEIGRGAPPAVSNFKPPFEFTGHLTRVVYELADDQDADAAAAAAAAMRRQ